MAQEAAGFGLAYDTWVSQGSGLKSDRRGTMRYNKGPMRGMTRDEAMAMFRNQVWNNAAPEWKDEYARRATSGMLSPSEQADYQRKQSQIRSMIPPRPSSATSATATPAPVSTGTPAMVSTSGGETPQQVKDRVLRQSQMPVRLNEDTPENKAIKSLIGTNTSVTPPRPASPGSPMTGQTGAASTIASSQAGNTQAQATLDQARQRLQARADAAKTTVSQPTMMPNTNAVLVDTRQPIGTPNQQNDVGFGGFINNLIQSSVPPSVYEATQKMIQKNEQIDAQRQPMTAPMPVNTQQPIGAQTNDVLSNEDLSGQGYTLVGNKGGVKKWRRGAEMSAQNSDAAAKTMSNVVKSPVFNARRDSPQNAPKPAPFTTKFDVTQGRIVATGGTPTADFQKYDAAQTRLKAGQDTDADKAMVKEYVGRDALSRTPDQIAQQKADERAGNYQSGRYVGSNRATAVQAPMFRR